jgi:hypothetical protein
MTKTQAVLLQRKWKRQGNPLYDHWIQELASSDFGQGHVLNAYHCRKCGELNGTFLSIRVILEAPMIEERLASIKTRA